MRTIILILYVCASGNWLRAQELPRRVFLGIRMEDVTDDTRRVMATGDIKGVLILEALPGSTAEAVGFKRGDILTSVNHQPVASSGEVIAMLAGYKSGEKFEYEVVRKGQPVKGKGVFKPMPQEQYADLDVIYTSVQSVAGRQRLIITKPKENKKRPVIVFIGGIGCYSLDNALDTTRPESRLLNSLSRAGYLVARVEKPGMGDNAKYCKACSEVSFNEELDGYVQAVAALKQRADADSSSVFVIGHSMGGVFAPMLAQKTTIKGIIAYGTIGSSFQEYLMKTRRTIAEAYEWTPVETDDYIKDYCECAGYYFVERMSTAEAAKKKADCKEYLGIFDYRSRAYNDELYAINIPGLWKPFKGKALLLWGESDYISSKADHQVITDAVNFYNSGHASMVTVPKASHGMQVASTFQVARTSPGAYNPAVGEAMLAWLKTQ